MSQARHLAASAHEIASARTRHLSATLHARHFEASLVSNVVAFTCVHDRSRAATREASAQVTAHGDQS